MLDGAGVRCRSRQRNTHSTESREVRYLWHPWCGRSVTVYETLTKGGQPVCRCGVDDQRNDRSLEVPAWMFEPALCDHLRVAAAPCVDGPALIELTTVLQTARRADVLEAQHDSVIAAGGADATVQPPSTSLATDAVSSAAFSPAFQMLPQDIQDRAIRLLARMLRLQVDQLRVSDEGREAHHE